MSSHPNPINPATGLPMTTDDTSGIDIGGNVYGTNNSSYGHVDTYYDNSWSPPDYSPPWDLGS